MRSSGSAFVLGAGFERLRGWLVDYAPGDPLDLDAFVSRLFTEVLSQPGFGFYGDLDAGRWWPT